MVTLRWEGGLKIFFNYIIIPIGKYFQVPDWSVRDGARRGRESRQHQPRGGRGRRPLRVHRRQQGRNNQARRKAEHLR